VLRLAREPRTDLELHALIRALWGVSLPNVQVCPDHVSPFHAVAHAFFAREPGYAVWYASRGSGKSLSLAVLGLTKTFVLDADTTILGGSMTQSQNVRDHMSQLLEYRNAPTYALRKNTATAIVTTTGKRIRPLPASQTTVRGPHPPLSLLDEVDEMEYDIYEAAMGQAMEQVNVHGQTVQEYIVASSTWQNPDGTFTKIMEDARDKGLPIFTWCWRELLKGPNNPYGWMTERFIEGKRRAVSAQMWKTEYELNEPSGSDRAFDLDKVEKYFIDYPDPVHHVAHGLNDEEWVFEEWEPSGDYYGGADWAKNVDKTIIGVIRTDVYPRRLVYLRRVNRLPWPEMIAMFDKAVEDYHCAGAEHDSTGLGNVAHDFSEAATADSSTVKGFDFRLAKKRTEMLLDYITEFEHGAYELPKSIPDQAPETNKGLVPFYRAHRNTTTADVYAPSKWDAHLPDDVAMMALAHKAAKRAGPSVSAIGVKRTDTPRKVDQQFHVPAGPSMQQEIGGVTVVDERYDDSGVFWLSPED